MGRNSLEVYTLFSFLTTLDKCFVKKNIEQNKSNCGVIKANIQKWTLNLIVRYPFTWNETKILYNIFDQQRVLCDIITRAY